MSSKELKELRRNKKTKAMEKCVLLCYDYHMELYKRYGKNVKHNDPTSFLLNKW